MIVYSNFNWVLKLNSEEITVDPLVLNQIDLPAFIQLFIVSAIGCSLVHILYQRFYDRKPNLPAIGAFV